ncbi:MAG: PAS domain S-box protein [Clostridiales bacterium]|nr:PAS domain S-box protein [Clostridiales bacterium]
MNKNLYEIGFEKSNIPMAVFEGSTIVKCNQALADCLKVSNEEGLIGKTLVDISPEFQPDGERSSFKIERIWKEKSLDNYKFKWFCLAEDGESYWFEITLTFIYEDDIPLVFSIWKDITRDKLIEDQFVKVSKTFEIFETFTPNLVDVRSADEKFISINKSWINSTGYSEKEFLNMTFEDIIHPDDLEIYYKEKEILSKGKIVRDCILRVRSKEGNYRTIEWNCFVEDDLFYDISQDISDKVFAAKKRRLLFENMEEGLVLHKIIYDEKGIPIDYALLEANDSFYLHTGIEKKVEEGILASEYYGTGKAPFLEVYSEVARTGKPYSYVTYFEPLDKYFKISATSSQKGYFASIFSDITEIKKSEESYYAEKERLLTTLKSIGDAVITTDADGKVTLMNAVAEELTGWKSSEAEGKPLSEVFHIINEKTRRICENPVDKVLKEGKVVELANHTAIISRQGVEKSIADSAAPIKNKQGQIFGVVLVFRDVDEAKKKEEEVLYLSFHDKLTGLYNRAFFEEQLKLQETKGEYPFSIIIGDVNGLKITNDVFGHAEGDNILKKIAKILTKCCRKEDTIARWGGDEFIVLLPKAEEFETDEICKRIQEECNKTTSHTIRLSIALGRATKYEKNEKHFNVIKMAEEMMYRQKLLESKSFRSSVIASLKKTLSERSNETEEHAERIAKVSAEIGKLIGLNESEIADLKLLSMLHDIGKIAVNDSILMKPGPLTEEEWKEMKKHSEIGYRIAQATPELSQYADYILSHHERWDGNGYPQKLKENEIPLLSRIVAIADAYDVMTNERAYSKAVTHKEAIKEIKKCAGTQFDPKIVEKFIEIYDK